jgi:peptidoglycan biosynthesis protein MviN/MurJ (putative lipid II flippase)
METHRKIFRAVLTVGAFVLLGRVFGAVREILFAARFGTSEIVDAYILTSSIITWPTAVWMSTLTAIAVPLLVRSDAEGPSATAKFVGELSAVSLAGGLALTALIFAALWYLAGASVLGLSSGAAAAMREMLAPLCLTLPLGLLITVLSVRLMSQQRHINTLLDGVPALAVSAALLLIVPLTPAELAWATVAGFAAQAFILSSLLKGNGAALAAPRTFATPQWRMLTKGLAYFVLGQLAVGAIAFVDPLMVAGLGAGSIATLGYANRILALGLGITATAVARAVLPAFSQLSAEPDRLIQAAKSWIGWLVLAGVLCAAIGWLAAPWVVKILFERGQFTPANTQAVSDILRLGLLQLPFYLSGIVAVQVLAAQGRHHEITRSGLINVVVKLAANVPLIAAFGVAGTMLATTIMYAVALGYLWWAAFVKPAVRPAVQSG